jgi:iron complex outermembrane receptor protein
MRFPSHLSSFVRPVARAVLALGLSSSFAAAQDFVIGGKVTSTDGQPVSGAHLRIVELSRHTDAGPNGAYRFDAVPRGSYLIEARSDRFGVTIVRVDPPASGSPVVDIVLSVATHEEAIVVNSGLDATALVETAKPITVLAGLDLASRMKSTLGETLAEQPGVSSTSFGPGASRPVIRGMGGDRVRILQGGVGTADASNTSPDHAVSFDPLSAEQIEVVRGPATLLYGSTAIGGVVNVIDGRIPEARAERAVGGVFDLALGSVSDEKQGGASLQGGKKGFAWHADALHRTTGDVRVPLDEGNVPNSATENTSGSLGASIVGDRGFFGTNAAVFNTNYGIPSEDGVTIDMKQRRLDLKGAIREPFGAFRGLRVRVGVADYEHSELEGQDVGTRFESQGYEGRAEFLHKDLGALKGAFGFQAQGRNLTVTGEEAFLPPSQTRSLAAFVLEEIGSGRTRLALGGRVERQAVDLDRGDSRSMTGVSGSAGVTVRANDGLAFGLTLSYSERLPGAEELFSDGPHAATNAYEIGDPDLAKEKSLGFDASIKKSGGPLTGEVSFFRNAFTGYIFESFTEEEIDELQVVRYEQRDATFSGFEARAEARLVEGAEQHLSLEGSVDYVRAEVQPTSDPLPRIAPARMSAAIHYRDPRFDARAEVRRTGAQDRVSEFETPTEAYTFINAAVSYRIFGGSRTVTDLLLRGTNLTDSLGRNHVSYLKDLVPLPGRDVRAAVRFRF